MWLIKFSYSVLLTYPALPVFICRPGSLLHQPRTVVVPIGTRFPESKLAMISALKYKTKLQVKLVIFEHDDPAIMNAKEVFLQTFRVFKNQFPNTVHCETLGKGNKARLLLQYCASVEADILIVQPGEETRLGDWTADHIPSSSNLQVLAIC